MNPSAYDAKSDPHTRGLSRATTWLVVLAFAGFTSLTSAACFEWRHHQAIVGWNTLPLTPWDYVCLLWLLTAKSLMLLSPLLVPVGLLIALKRNGTALVILGIWWFILFYWMAVDLLIMSFSGNHAVTYVPFLYDMFLASDKQYGNWVGDGVTYIASIVPLSVLAWGLCSFFLVRWTLVRLVRRFAWLESRLSLTVATTGCFLAVALLFPALTFFSQPSALRRMDASLPLYLPFLETGVNRTRGLLALLRGNALQDPGARVLRFQPATQGIDGASGSVTVHNAGNAALHLEGWKLHDHLGGEFPLAGNLARGQSRTIPVPNGALSLADDCRILLADATGWPRHLVGCDGEQRFFDRFSPDRAQAQAERFLNHVDRSADAVAELLQRDGPIVGPADDTAIVKDRPLPNVIVLVLESFRNSVVSPDVMRRLDAFSAKGLRLEKHYSGSNCTHMGFFSLLYGRTPIFFNQTLDRNIPPQMCETMRRSGYHGTFLSSGAHEGFRRIQDFINEQTFDKVLIDEKGEKSDFSEWPEADPRILAKVAEIISSRPGQPQFVVSLLWSTHCPYVYPERFRIHRDDGSDRSLREWTTFSPEVLNNRYKNAALFLEDELMRFIASLDLDRNILIITGDHGESMGEDGFRSHTGPASEVQTRVPFIMVGGGMQPKRMGTATGHTDILPTLLHVLAGKPVPIRYSHGRDLLEDPHPADQALVVPLMWPELSKLVLIRGDQRILLDVKTQGDLLRSARFAAFLDDSGMYRLRVARSPAAVATGRTIERAGCRPVASPTYRP